MIEISHIQIKFERLNMVILKELGGAADSGVHRFGSDEEATLKAIFLQKDIPPDIVYSVLNSLSTKCLHRLQAVSRMWFHMIQEIIARRSSDRKLLTSAVTGPDTCSMLEVTILDGNWRAVGQLWERLYHSYHRSIVSRALNQSPILFPTACPAQSCHGIICLGMDDGNIILCNPATEQFLQLPLYGARYQCIGLAYTGGEYKVIVWFTDRLGQNVCTIFTLGPNPWRDGRRAAIDPPFRVMSGRAPYIEGCVHVLPDLSEYESHGFSDRIEPFHADSEAYCQSIRLPSSFYMRSKRPTTRNLFEMDNCLSICITLDDCIEMWRLSDYHRTGWVMDHHLRLNSLMPEPYRHHAIMVDPVTVLQDGQIVMNVAMRQSPVQLVSYDPVENKVTFLGLENHALTSYKETIFDLREPEPGDPRFGWSPIVNSDEKDLVDHPDPNIIFSSDSGRDLADCNDSDPSSSSISPAPKRQRLQSPNPGTSVEAHCSEGFLYGYLPESCITIDEKDGPEEEEGCMMSIQEEVRYSGQVFTAQDSTRLPTGLGFSIKNEDPSEA